MLHPTCLDRLLVALGASAQCVDAHMNPQLVTCVMSMWLLHRRLAPVLKHSSATELSVQGYCILLYVQLDCVATHAGVEHA